MGPVGGPTCGPVSKVLFVRASSGALHLTEHGVAWSAQVNYGQILTGKMKIAPCVRTKQGNQPYQCLHIGLLGLSSALLNSDLLAISGATPDACIASV